jgi:hypothetical protein
MLAAMNVGKLACAATLACAVALTSGCKTTTPAHQPSGTTTSAHATTGSPSPTPAASSSSRLPTPSTIPVLPSAAAGTTAPYTPAPTHEATAPATPPAPGTPAAGGGGTCSIRADSGNCYNAGEFCRKADVGKSTTDAAGRSITCSYEDGDKQPHWHY